MKIQGYIPRIFFICIEGIKMIKRGICHCMITDLALWLSMS